MAQNFLKIAIPSPPKVSDIQNYENVAEQQQKGQQQLLWRCRMVLQLTGLYLDPNHQRPIRRCVHVAFALFAMVLEVYESGWIIFNVILNTGQHVSMIRFVIWTTKALIVQALLLFWQCRGRLELVLDTVIRPHAPRARPLLRLITLLWLSFSLIYLFLILTGFVYFQLRLHGIVDKGACFRYGTFFQMVTRNFVWWTSMWTLTSVLIFFNICVRAVQLELEEFSKAKMPIGADQSEDTLFRHFNNYLAILNRIECLNNVFQIYLFLMISTSIPNTIFTLLRFLQSPITGPLHFLFTVPETLFCLFELAGLTVSAAQLHSNIKEIPKNYYLNTNFADVIGNESQYRIRKLIMHVTNQPNMGITLWGFATITKQLIMTVMSMIVTYLTVILQVIPVDAKNDFWKIKV